MPEQQSTSTAQSESLVNRAQLIRFMDDLMAGWSMGLTSYETSLDRIADGEIRLKLGEFKADLAHDREYMRALIRNMGGEPSPTKFFAANVGARIQTLISGNMGNDAYAAAMVLGELAAGEDMARLGLERLREVGDRIKDPQIRDFARGALERTKERKDYLESRHRDTIMEALFGMQKVEAGASSRGRERETASASASGGRASTSRSTT